MNKPLPAQEGQIPFRGFNTWYRVVGDGEQPGKLPLLCLHGGPGVPHDYLEPLEALAATGRRVIFYDQLGCGNSLVKRVKEVEGLKGQIGGAGVSPVDKKSKAQAGTPMPPSSDSDAPSLHHSITPPQYTVDLFVEEVGVVRRALGLDRVHLLGQSWGGMLAMQYALTQPTGLASLTVASSPASMKQWVAEANRLRDQLPPEVQETLLRHERAGTTHEKEYEDACEEFYHRHVCRIVPYPRCVQRAFDKVTENPEVYHTLNGPSEFHVIGPLKDWDITARLGEIRVPTLVTSGRHDEATPLIAATVHQGIKNSEQVIFENSAHMAHVEEAERYMQVLEVFLRKVEVTI